jgi:hypothetical protein
MAFPNLPCIIGTSQETFIVEYEQYAKRLDPFLQPDYVGHRHLFGTASTSCITYTYLVA